MYNELYTVQTRLVTQMKVPNRRRPPELFKMIESTSVKQMYFLKFKVQCTIQCTVYNSVKCILLC